MLLGTEGVKSWWRQAKTCSNQLTSANCTHPFPILRSVTSCRQLETGHGENILSKKLTNTTSNNATQKDFSQVVVNEAALYNCAMSSCELGLSQEKTSFFWYFLRHCLPFCPKKPLLLSGKRWHTAQLRHSYGASTQLISAKLGEGFLQR